MQELVGTKIRGVKIIPYLSHSKEGPVFKTVFYKEIFISRNSLPEGRALAELQNEFLKELDKKGYLVEATRLKLSKRYQFIGLRWSMHYPPIDATCRYHAKNLDYLITKIRMECQRLYGP